MNGDHSPNSIRRVFLVINPVAGFVDSKALERRCVHFFEHQNWDYEVYQTTGDHSVTEVVQDAVQRGFDLFIAAGGDGTISAVAGGLVHTDIPLAILPVGTGNLLAREMNIPLNAAGALNLITAPHRIRHIDAMDIGGEIRILNMSIGISSLTMMHTDREQKRRFGMLAYVWNILLQVLGLRMVRFSIQVDGKLHNLRASEVMVTNGGLLAIEPFRWQDDITLDDGRIDVVVLRARSLWDILSLIVSTLLRRQNKNPVMRIFGAYQNITIHTGRSMPVQADGDLMGTTPVMIRVLPHAVNVIVPARQPVNLRQIIQERVEHERQVYRKLLEDRLKKQAKLLNKHRRHDPAGE